MSSCDHINLLPGLYQAGAKSVAIVSDRSLLNFTCMVWRAIAR
jgi:hypothetical protein